MNDLALAELRDCEEIASLILELSAWLHSQGILQWANPTPQPEIERDIRAGKVFIWRGEGGTLATITLVENIDPMWENPHGAAYIHRLAVPRELKGLGLGKKLVAWAESEALRRGISCLRLDCAADNQTLREYYQSLGFVFQKTTYYAPFKMEFALFEKQLR
jgi:ribosomal protein S18 acetylase RimI-like enzyme